MIESFPSRCQEVREVDSLLGELMALPCLRDWRLILLDPADGEFWEMTAGGEAQRVDEAVRSAVNSLAAQTCGGAGCVFVADGQGMPEPASVSLATLAAKAGVVACFGSELRAVLLMKDLPGSDIQHASLVALGMILGTSLERLRLQDELELLGVVPRGVAHDLQSLLTPIDTFFQLAESPAHRLGELEPLLKSARLNLSAICDLLLARPAEGVVDRSACPVNLAVLVERAVTLWRRAARERDVELSVSGLAECLMPGDPRLLTRLILNLLSNAIEAAPKGSSVFVKIVSGEPEGTVSLSVAETGQGMPAAQVMNLFPPYFLRQRSRANRLPTGLGLAISRAVAQRHGGSLVIESSPEQGTVVRVSLPKGPDEASL